MSGESEENILHSADERLVVELSLRRNTRPPPPENIIRDPESYKNTH